ncbi:hypothetical protein [Methylomicrobium lacus]|uniref:hypothetical protein n=1 Tax=Methylomicrobium lacus TaxID=136992 RepID=UPI0035A85D7C
MNTSGRSLLLFAILLSTIPTGSAFAADCESPSDYVRKVYSTEEGKINYELDPALNYKEITVTFFGKRGQVKRNNTVVKLDSHTGTISVPESALAPPAQLWFNFIVKDSADCTRWGLVNETPLNIKDNLIGIDNPSGEGDAFFIKPKR